MHQVAQHVPAIVQSLEPLINKYGYIAVGGLLILEDFGVPAPGETVLIAAAFYAGLGQLNILLVILIGILGAILGDNIGFAIGHFGGHPLAERFGKYVFLTPERINKAEVFFKRHGGKVIVIARFVEGLRQANGIIAGISEMHWRRFLTFNIIGASLWVVVWSLLGYFGGSHISTFLHYQLYFSLSVLAVVITYAMVRIIKSRRSKRTHAK